MSKKITIVLSEKAEAYFDELKYSMPAKSDGSGTATHSQVINDALESLAAFEKHTGDQLWNWLGDNGYVHNAKQNEQP